MAGVREKNIFPLYGQTKFTGNVEFPLFPQQGIEFLAGAIGADVVTGTADPYTHTISPANTLASWTIEKNLGGYESEQYAGCRINKIDIDCTTGNQEAKATAEVIAQSVAVLSSPTAVSLVSTDTPFVPENQVTLSALGTARTDATSCKVSFTNNLKATYTLDSSNNLAYLTPLARQCNGQIVVVWQSLDDATYGYLKKMPIGGGSAVTGTLVLTISQGANRQIVLTLNQIQLSKLADDIKMSDVVMTTLDFEASYVIGSSLLSCVVKNGRSTQYC